MRDPQQRDPAEGSQRRKERWLQTYNIYCFLSYFASFNVIYGEFFWLQGEKKLISKKWGRHKKHKEENLNHPQSQLSNITTVYTEERTVCLGAHSHIAQEPPCRVEAGPHSRNCADL